MDLKWDSERERWMMIVVGWKEAGILVRDSERVVSDENIVACYYDDDIVLMCYFLVVRYSLGESRE